MIVLHTLPSAWGMVSVSPFCTKLEVYLRMRGLAYRAVFGDPRRAPRGKVPYIEHEGRVITDSQRAIEHLEARGPEALDAWLSPASRALGHVTRRALEEGLYFVGAYSRWFDPPSWRVYAPVYGPYLRLANLVLPLFRLRIRAALVLQGTARHTLAEAYDLGRRDLDATAELLGDRAFILGDRPSTVDATVFAFVSSVVDFPVATPLSDAVRAHPNLVAHAARVRARFLHDWTPVVVDGRRG